MKNIVFCADGTWNGPGKKMEDRDLAPDATNVLKIYHWLAGKDTLESTAPGGEAERTLYDNGGRLIQIAKYLDGVGHDDNWLVKLIGGVFGAGLIARIVRGYTFISRNYEPGDNITLIGFSRGAYTARALAGLILDQGLLDPHDGYLTDREMAYRVACSVWTAHQRSIKAHRNAPVATGFDMLLSDLPAFFTQPPTHGRLIKDVPIKAVAVWDTVGSLGIPMYAGKDDRIDAFQFSDTVLSTRVERGLHAISMDEIRVDFTPTLWKEASHVRQRLFSGAHADVGGGYHPKESALSDKALVWIKEQLTHLEFGASPSTMLSGLRNIAHQPWKDLPYSLFDSRHFAPRDFSKRPDIERPDTAPV